MWKYGFKCVIILTTNGTTNILEIEVYIMRRKLIAGNWKMNMTPSQAVKLVNELKPHVDNKDVDVLFCVPAIDIIPVINEVKDTDIEVGAENVFYEEKGAYTGELSPEMLVDAGVKYVIIGHSERRQYFNEDDDIINKKLKKVVEHDLIPILCCGETLEQREDGVTLDFIRKQINNAFKNIPSEKAINCVIAYEPIWAIGTGKTATSEDANNSIKEIRNKIAQIYGQEIASRVIIQYGGSVKSTNAKELFSMSDIDGGLVGGASLKAEEFSKIVQFEK